MPETIFTQRMRAEEARRAAAREAMIQKASQTDANLIDTIGIQHGKRLPCPICGKSKWKTRLRGTVYKCRTCGYQREADELGTEGLPG